MNGPADTHDPRPVLDSHVAFSGRVWSVRTDTVELEHGEHVVRDVLDHPGAVGVIALDEADRVLLVRQYRHPAGGYLWEAPAGLLDVPGESALDCARRELLEEAGYLADEWHVLYDVWNSPGGSTEAFRCFLARGLRPAPDGRPAGVGEEHDLPQQWVDLDEAVAAVLAGRLGNPTTVTGTLAAAVVRAEGWRGLRPPDAPWPARPTRA